MVIKCFILLLSVPGKLKNSTFEMPIIPQTFNVNNLKATNAKSTNLHTIRNLIEYSLKNVKATFTLTIFEILLFEARSVLSPAQQGTGSEMIQVCSFISPITLLAETNQIF